MWVKSNRHRSVNWTTTLTPPHSSQRSMDSVKKKKKKALQAFQIAPSS